MTLRIGFVTGATPDKWARAWRDRSREPLELVPLTEADQESTLREGRVDMALVRLPIEREGVHVVRLYDERPVAVIAADHTLSLLEELSTADLDEEQLVAPHRSGWSPSADQLAWPPMDDLEAIETVAAGTGVVIVPMSVARLRHRRDVTSRVVSDLPVTTVGLAWLVERDDEPRMQQFVGVVRGRSARSSRG